MVWVMFFSCLHLMREVVLKERVISSSGFVYRAFGEEEGEGNSVGSNSLGGALADYNMQVQISTKNINVWHFNRISLTGHPLHASSLLRKDEETETCD